MPYKFMFTAILGFFLFYVPNIDITHAQTQKKTESKKDNFKDIQTWLKQLGLYSGAVDGVVGKGTRNAWFKFAKSAGINPSSDNAGSLLRYTAESTKGRNLSLPVATWWGRKALEGAENSKTAYDQFKKGRCKNSLISYELAYFQRNQSLGEDHELTKESENNLRIVRSKIQTRDSDCKDIQRQKTTSNKEFNIRLNTIIGGGALNTTRDVDVERCQSICANQESCRAFTYNKSARICTTKVKIGERINFEGAISGIKEQPITPLEGKPMKKKGYVFQVWPHGKLNLRGGPSAENSTIRTLPPGTMLKEFRREEGWSEVQAKRGGRGWVNNGYILDTNLVKFTKPPAAKKPKRKKKSKPSRHLGKTPPKSGGRCAVEVEKYLRTCTTYYGGDRYTDSGTWERCRGIKSRLLWKEENGQC